VGLSFDAPPASTGPRLVLSSGGAVAPRPLLSLVTATYRRVEELTALLRSHAAHLPGHTDEVEVVVCDNASGDGTEGVVRDFTAQHPEITLRYYRQAKNVGVDRNILDVLSLAAGEFVWFLADDDEIAAGQLAVVLEVLRGLDSEILLVRANNVAEWDLLPATGSETVEWIDPGLPEWAPTLFASSFLASAVFRLESLAETVRSVQPLIGTCYAAWGVTLTLLSRAARVPYLDQLCLLGNVNYRGHSTFQNYRVMIDGRTRTWDFAAGGRVRTALAPLMVRHAIGGLRGAAAASLWTESRRELVTSYLSSLRVHGPVMLRGLPWVGTVVVLPVSMRRALDRVRLLAWEMAQ
jgi:hypothetical protein